MKNQDSDRSDVVQEMPDISDEQVAKLMVRIRPLIRLADNSLHYVRTTKTRSGKKFNPRKTDITCYADVFWDKRQVKNLVPLKMFRSIHTIWGYPGFFQPNVAEVLAQIPDFWDGDAEIAFEVLTWNVLIDYYHISQTVLYRRAEK